MAWRSVVHWVDETAAVKADQKADWMADWSVDQWDLKLVVQLAV
jgi:hypothetical protein